MAVKSFSDGAVLKIFDMLFMTRVGRIAMRLYAMCMLLVLVALADVMPSQVVVSVLAMSLMLFLMTALKEVSTHRGEIAARACDLLPLAVRAVDLTFALLVLPVRIFAAPARARPRLAPGRIGRLPAVTLSPRLLPIPFASRA